METPAEKIQNFLMTERAFRDLIGERSLEADTPILEQGILDSIGIFDLVGFLESQFHFRVESQDIVESNFRSIANIENYVLRKMELLDKKE
jgi:acyl carrier protein